MKRKIRKGDRVLVIAGNNKGKAGEVLNCSDSKVVVQGVNIRKKHRKRSSSVPVTGIPEFEMPIHISNVSLCDKENRPLKVRVRVSSDGAKDLVVGPPGQESVYRSVKKV